MLHAKARKFLLFYFLPFLSSFLATCPSYHILPHFRLICSRILLSSKYRRVHYRTVTFSFLARRDSSISPDSRESISRFSHPVVTEDASRGSNPDNRIICYTIVPPAARILTRKTR